MVDSEKIEDVNKIVIQHATSAIQFSSYYYFNVFPSDIDDFDLDMVFFDLESENESGLDKKLKDLIESLNSLNTLYSIRDECTKELIVEIENVIALHIKFDNVKIIKEGTYKKIDELNHLKTEFGFCKSYNPNFRAIENTSIENMKIEHEIIFLFSDSAENLSQLKILISEKIMQIDSNFEIELKPFEFID